MFDKYPYTDLHELNLDWIIAQIMKLHKDYDEFKAVNTITNAGAWDITRQYQAWTIVSNNNAGYISMKPVPAGININNTEYWGLVADYDILITDLSGRISTLEGQMNTLNNTTIPGINSDISDTNDRITTVGNRVTDLENYNYFSGRKFWYIGDSFSLLNNGWPVKMDTYAGKNNSVLTGEGGIGFVNPGNDTGLTLAELVESISATTVTGVTDVICVAGINDCDAAYISNLTLYIQNFVDKVMEKVPKARIWIAFNPTYFTSAYSARYPYVSQVYGLMASYCAQTGNACFIKSVAYALQYRSLVTSDGVHPNEAGSISIARALLNKLKFGTDSCPVWDVVSHGIHYRMGEMGFISLETVNAAYFYNDPNNLITVNGGSFTQLYADANAPVWPKYTYQFAFRCRCMITTAGNNQYVEDCMLLPTTDGKLSILCENAYSNVKAICPYHDCITKTVPIFSYATF